MKITEIINRLREILRQEGNIEVICDGLEVHRVEIYTYPSGKKEVELN